MSENGKYVHTGDATYAQIEELRQHNVRLEERIVHNEKLLMLLITASMGERALNWANDEMLEKNAIAIRKKLHATSALHKSKEGE